MGPPIVGLGLDFLTQAGLMFCFDMLDPILWCLCDHLSFPASSECQRLRSNHWQYGASTTQLRSSIATSFT